MLLQHFVLGEVEESPVSEAWFGNELENAVTWIGGNYSQIALEKRTKSPTPSVVEVEAETPTDFKGSWVSVLEQFSNIVSKCEH